MDLRQTQRTLLRVKRLIDEALPKFNWGAAALDANAITLLNEVPAEVERELAALEAELSIPKLKGCPRCFGSGGKRSDPCTNCQGTGRVPR